MVPGNIVLDEESRLPREGANFFGGNELVQCIASVASSQIP